MRARRNRQLANVQSADMSMSCLALNEPSMTSSPSANVLESTSPSADASGVTYTERGKMIRSRSTATPMTSTTSGQETIGDRMRQRRSRNLTSEESSESPSPTPEVTPSRSARTPSTPAVTSQTSSVGRTVSDGGGSSAATPSERMKERMDRRRRERGGTMSERDVTTRSSIDLSTLRQKSSTHDVTSGVKNNDVTTTHVCRLNEHAQGCDHAVCNPQQLRRATSVSASQETLNLTPEPRSVASAAISRRQRREAWRNSCSNISEQSPPEVTSSRARKVSSGGEEARKKATEARENRDRPWRAANRPTADTKTGYKNGTLSRDGVHSSHQNLSSTHSDFGSRARRREAWRGSQGNLDQSSSSPSTGGGNSSLSRSQRREMWRNSQTSLSNDVSTSAGTNGGSHDASNGRRERERTSTTGHLLGDNKLQGREEEALSERDYRERLRRLSRSRHS